MKINEVEAAVGVTKKNIRFYEEEGLISPSREPGNGSRSYSQADVERLRRIKLLRKLDVPLAEIRQMLEGECTLAEGMTRQLERLHTRRTDLDEAVNFCTLLQKEPVSLNELDVEQTLARLTAKEEQGVSFVNIEQTDRKAERVRGALVGAGLFTALMLFIMGIMVWASCVDPEEALHGTCEKFIRRFRAMEEAAARKGRELTELTLEELTALWNGAKERS